jgi:hypothetical protein
MIAQPVQRKRYIEGRDIGHILENIVYLELKRRGYNVRVKFGSRRVKFDAPSSVTPFVGIILFETPIASIPMLARRYLSVVLNTGAPAFFKASTACAIAATSPLVSAYAFSEKRACRRCYQSGVGGK